MSAPTRCLRVAPSAAAKDAGGFTLLELVVAIGVFAIMAALAYGGLSSVLNTRVSVQRALDRTAVYERAYIKLRDDFLNASDRDIRDENGNRQPAMIYDRYRQRLEFTRGGRPNPLGLPRSDFERVAYGLQENGHFVRYNWTVLDRAPRSEPQELVLLDDVDKARWRFLDTKLQWHDHWPLDDYSAATATSVPAPPIAVELQLDTRDWGSLRFVFQLGVNPDLQTTSPPGIPTG